ncbi:MAG: hypothetical protein UU84_C0006G0003 [Candidatus Yanofskybacteria bacterium GW2011_GWC2_41_9]|uniref:Uncharacterized protein n=1 Tax=Candidatus Yanofskybacteria bacterium GW2011_GWC2_41_9 TaxID=1619029 RepID=A0A0G0XSF5_9BACT|nr:MAG: hypothetical protein UU84_C0006G0003 [Candidatus Yanofskybacteria bacterium GW2011_GWC2_41_9]
MNKLIKNKKIIFLILVFSFLIPYSLFLIPTPAQAQVKLETGLPGIPASGLPVGQELPSYINYLFIFSLGLVTILALTQMIIGGITYILAAGNAAKVEDAKDMIFQALLGVGILLISYLLLRTINPDLVNLRNPNLTPTKFQPIEQPLIGNEQEKEGAPCNEGEVSGSPPNVAICINGQWKNTSNMLP